MENIPLGRQEVVDMEEAEEMRPEGMFAQILFLYSGYMVC